jgi:hypothetical protein
MMKRQKKDEPKPARKASKAAKVPPSKKCDLCPLPWLKIVGAVRLCEAHAAEAEANG